jgi:plasmid stabilization system protein ParE
VTPFDVEWSDEAIAELAEIWTRAADRSAVTAAEARITSLLRRDPHNNGTHRSEELYGWT